MNSRPTLLRRVFMHYLPATALASGVVAAVASGIIGPGGSHVTSTTTSADCGYTLTSDENPYTVWDYGNTRFSQGNRSCANQLFGWILHQDYPGPGPANTVL
jgi:hypothetical protein